MSRGSKEEVFQEQADESGQSAKYRADRVSCPSARCLRGHKAQGRRMRESEGSSVSDADHAVCSLQSAVCRFDRQDTRGQGRGSGMWNACTGHMRTSLLAWSANAA